MNPISKHRDFLRSKLIKKKDITETEQKIYEDDVEKDKDIEIQSENDDKQEDISDSEQEKGEEEEDISDSEQEDEDEEEEEEDITDSEQEDDEEEEENVERKIVEPVIPLEQSETEHETQGTTFSSYIPEKNDTNIKEDLSQEEDEIEFGTVEELELPQNSKSKIDSYDKTKTLNESERESESESVSERESESVSEVQDVIETSHTSYLSGITDKENNDIEQKTIVSDDETDIFDTSVKNIENYYVETQRDLYSSDTSIIFSPDEDSISSVENENVHPIKLYRYNIDYNTTVDKLNKIKANNRIYVCPFRIISNGFIPYLQYYLYKYPASTDERINDLMIFSYFKYQDNGISAIEQTNQYINTIFSLNTTGDEKLIEHSGIINYNGNYYVFYDISDVIEKETIEEMTKKRNDKWWWCIIDEIVNYKKVLNFPVFIEHVNLFLNNPSMIYLYNVVTLEEAKKNDTIPKPLEIPCIGFHGTYYNLKDFILSQGLRPSTINSMVGPYYYFGTFRKAVRYAGWTSTYDERFINGEPISDKNGRYNRGAIIRFALFTGNMTALLNHPTDREDMSSTVIKRLRDKPGDKYREKMIIKMHDHDAKWAENYDSIYIGKALLANGKTYMSNPEFIIKESYMIDTLSGHELDQETLEEKWNSSKEDYNIL